jgi:hypothetical protein
MPHTAQNPEVASAFTGCVMLGRQEERQRARGKTQKARIRAQYNNRFEVSGDSESRDSGSRLLPFPFGVVPFGF